MKSRGLAGGFLSRESRLAAVVVFLLELSRAAARRRTPEGETKAKKPQRRRAAALHNGIQSEDAKAKTPVRRIDAALPTKTAGKGDSSGLILGSRRARGVVVFVTSISVRFAM
jgi:hypothetical protein